MMLLFIYKAFIAAYSHYGIPSNTTFRQIRHLVEITWKTNLSNGHLVKSEPSDSDKHIRLGDFNEYPQYVF